MYKVLCLKELLNMSIPSSKIEILISKMQLVLDNEEQLNQLLNQHTNLNQYTNIEQFFQT